MPSASGHENQDDEVSPETMFSIVGGMTILEVGQKCKLALLDPHNNMMLLHVKNISSLAIHKSSS